MRLEQKMFPFYEKKIENKCILRHVYFCVFIRQGEIRKTENRKNMRKLELASQLARTAYTLLRSVGEVRTIFLRTAPLVLGVQTHSSHTFCQILLFKVGASLFALRSTFLQMFINYLP